MSKQVSLERVAIKAIHTLIPNTIGKYSIRYELQTKNGIALSKESLPDGYMEYMEKAINSYGAEKKEKKEGHALAKLVLPGKLVAKSEGKRVAQDADGRFVLAPMKNYTQRISSLRRQRDKIIADDRGMPIQQRVNVKCEFHVPEKDLPICLPEMIFATLDLLVKLKVLRTEKSNVVASTEGSCIIKSISKTSTVVTITKIVED